MLCVHDAKIDDKVFSTSAHILRQMDQSKYAYLDKQLCAHISTPEGYMNYDLHVYDAVQTLYYDWKDAISTVSDRTTPEYARRVKQYNELTKIHENYMNSYKLCCATKSSKECMVKLIYYGEILSTIARIE